MGRPEDEGGELGSFTNQRSRDGAKRECITFATVMEMLLA